MKILPKLISSLLIASGLFFFLPRSAFAQDANADAAACIGKGLAEYMNAVIGGGPYNHIRLLSPAFNMTNPASIEIVNAMNTNSAKFNELSGIAGNSYNLVGKTITQWVNEFMSATKLSGSVFLTETGNYDTQDLNLLKTELSKIKGNSGQNYIAGLLFNAFNTNPEFSFQALCNPASDPSCQQIRQVCGAGCGKIGVNYATVYPQSVFLYPKAKDQAMNFILEIAMDDAPTVIDSLRVARANGATPVIRIGVEDDSGGFGDPLRYVAFLKEVDDAVNFPVYAIAGPNEPDAEYWATPTCPRINPAAPAPSLVTSQNPIPKPYVACADTSDPEFHSLRPYQASPCKQEVEQAVIFCGNDFWAKETYKHEHPDPYSGPVSIKLPNGESISCTAWSDDVSTCTYNKINSAIDVDITLDKAKLTILGNTELVPNSINQANLLDPATRMNEYVSWFLNGAIYQYEDTLPSQIRDILNFAGPIRKLLPQIAQLELHDDQKNEAGATRHNQFVDEGLRLSSANSKSEKVPFSSTEDRTGLIRGERKDESTDFPDNDDVIPVNSIVWNPSDKNRKSIDDIYFGQRRKSLNYPRYYSQRSEPQKLVDLTIITLKARKKNRSATSTQKVIGQIRVTTSLAHTITNPRDSKKKYQEILVTSLIGLLARSHAVAIQSMTQVETLTLIVWQSAASHVKYTHMFQ